MNCVCWLSWFIRIVGVSEYECIVGYFWCGVGCVFW